MRVIARLGMVLLALLSLAGGCGAEQRDPMAVSLEELVEHAERYDGNEVRAEGVVQRFGESVGDRHFWIEDTAMHRVGIHPARLAAPVVGHRVRVVGRFESTEATGRRIEIRRIGALETPADGT